MSDSQHSGKPLVLIIMDGIAHNPRSEGNAVVSARTPVLDHLLRTAPHTEVTTFGERVGLLSDQMGNSEVGHLNIGAGRVVEQELTRIHKAIEAKELGKLPEFAELMRTVKRKPERALHLIGLVSMGGVHSHLHHLQAIIKEAAQQGAKHIFVHAITDGRDRPPQVAVEEVGMLQKFIDELAPSVSSEIAIVSIIGRYFAMDRDTRWDRTKKAYELFTLGRGEKFEDPITALENRRARGAQDEFLEPIVITRELSRQTTIEDGDAILFFNFRADRMRQIVTAFLGEKRSFNKFDRDKKPKLSNLTTLTEYEETFPVSILFRPVPIKNHFGTVIANAGLKQLRIAETEKYAHVTYFFNGGEEVPLEGEERILVPSPREVPTYDHKPEMSAFEVTSALIQKIEEGKIDVAIVNYANCDMVGHTGVFEAAVRAVETVDKCVGMVLEALAKTGGTALVTADHGNCDQMIDYETGGPHTFHTKYPVYFIVVGEKLENIKLRSGGALCDIAPTMLQLLNLPQPAEMTGKSLIG